MIIPQFWTPAEQEMSMSSTARPLPVGISEMLSKKLSSGRRVEDA
jgi:hypothetical protein